MNPSVSLICPIVVSLLMLYCLLGMHSLNPNSSYFPKPCSSHTFLVKPLNSLHTYCQLCTLLGLCKFTIEEQRLCPIPGIFHFIMSHCRQPINILRNDQLIGKALPCFFSKTPLLEFSFPWPTIIVSSLAPWLGADQECIWYGYYCSSHQLLPAYPLAYSSRTASVACWGMLPFSRNRALFLSAVLSSHKLWIDRYNPDADVYVKTLMTNPVMCAVKPVFRF